MKLFYEKHIFLCTNIREDKKKKSCGNLNSKELRNYMKKKVKELGIKKVRINAAGCLNRCKLGPVLVSYPEGTWFRVKNERDVDDFIESYIKKNKKEKRLLISN